MSRKELLKFAEPMVMGILNITPDSFSDGGKFIDANEASAGSVRTDAAVQQALRMIADGVKIIDIGGESSGPGSKDVALEEELRRVVPVARALIKELETRGLRNQVLISIDTYKADVARKCLELGADIINDVTALRGDKEMAKVVAGFGAYLVMMYSKDPTARTTRNAVEYDNVMATIKTFFEERIGLVQSSDIKKGKIILDPGMGAFISTDPKYSFEILDKLAQFKAFNLPILVGASRKGFLGGTIDQRLEASLACAAIAVYNGASIIRAHDTAETVKLIQIVKSIMSSKNSGDKNINPK